LLGDPHTVESTKGEDDWLNQMSNFWAVPYLIMYWIAAFRRFVLMFRTFGGFVSILTGFCFRYTILESNTSLTFFTPSVSSSSTSYTNCRMKLSRT
jgi:hypothetical protein